VAARSGAVGEAAADGVDLWGFAAAGERERAGGRAGGGVAGAGGRGGRRGLAAGPHPGGSAGGDGARAGGVVGIAGALRVGLAGAGFEGAARAGGAARDAGAAGGFAGARVGLDSGLDLRRAARGRADGGGVCSGREPGEGGSARAGAALCGPIARDPKSAAGAGGAPDPLCGHGGGAGGAIAGGLCAGDAQWAARAVSALFESDEATGGSLAAESGKGRGARPAVGAVYRGGRETARAGGRRGVSLAGGGVSGKRFCPRTGDFGAGIGGEIGPLVGGRGEGGAGSGEGRSAAKIDCDQTHVGGGAGADGDRENAGQKKRAAKKLRRP